MTFDEFNARVQIMYNEQSNPKDLRLGQIFFNELCTVRPTIAEELRGSMLDPFYKERITQVVADFVRDRW